MTSTLRDLLLLILIGGLVLGTAGAREPVGYPAVLPPPAASMSSNAQTGSVNEPPEVEATMPEASGLASTPDSTPDSTLADSGSAKSDRDHSGQASYLDALGAEAASADDRPAPAAARTEPVGGGRADAIRGIVADALERPRQPSVPQKASFGPDDSGSAARSRRDELRSAVSNAGQATGVKSDRYISTLRQEGERTSVIDEETSRRPAIARQLPPSAPVVALPDDPAEDGQTYRVQQGDSFWRIAERLYGDGYKFLMLYEANKDRVNDENLLVVGQVLRVPPLSEFPNREPGD